ncbi:hypothetical protein OG21DRAFT_1499527 [Imleria badia]|nr:hypothetical protein OG21DRAFT_1499527 [Imleria badia]
MDDTTPHTFHDFSIGRPRAVKGLFQTAPQVASMDEFRILRHSNSSSALKVPDGLLVGSGVCTADASIHPQEVYDGGLGGKDIRLRIANGGAGQSKFIAAWANAFIQYCVEEGIAPPFKVAWYLGDTTESLGFLAAGEVDIAVTYNDAAEKQACKTSAAVQRVYGFRDHFFLVGPTSDPANLKNCEGDVIAMFNRIVDQGNKDLVTPPNDREPVRFLSRFDKSATNIKESELFCAIGQVPWALAYSKWYHQYPRFPLQALRAASVLSEYTLTDKGTWLSSTNEVRSALSTFAEGGDTDPNDPLLNPAHVILGAKAGPENQVIWKKFMEWVKLPDGGQKVAKDFKKPPGPGGAATVFLNPPDSLPSRLSSQQANLVLAAHLGLEQFEVVNQPGQLNHLLREREFVGNGDQSALLLLVDEAYAHDVVPSTFKPSFSFSESQSESLSSFLQTCSRRASHVYTYVASEPSIPTQGIPRTLDIFSAPTPANEAFLAEISTLVNYLDSLPASDRFAALELTGIPKLVALYGRSSEQYTLATDTLRAAIAAALVDKSVRLALVTYPPSTQRRSPLLADQSAKNTPSLGPVKGLSSCFSSFVSCTDATNDCSGHGQCTNTTRAGQECFVCACTTTVSEAGKLQNWAGEMCERRDVSGPFVLITGTVITLILLMGGSVSLLYGINGQELPSILTGGVNGGARKE